MNTISKSWPSGVRSSHLRVPSVETCSVTTSGRAIVETLGEPGALRLGDVAHRREIGGAAIVDLVPELLGAQFRLPLVEPGLGQRLADLGLGQADQVDARAVGRRRRGAGPGPDRSDREWTWRLS